MSEQKLIDQVKQENKKFNQPQASYDIHKNACGNDDQASTSSSDKVELEKPENLQAKVSVALESSIATPVKIESPFEALSSRNVSACSEKVREHSALKYEEHISSNVAEDVFNANSTKKSISSAEEQLSSMAANSCIKSKIYCQDPHSETGTTEMSQRKLPGLSNAPRPESLAIQASSSSNESSESDPETTSTNFSKGVVKKKHPTATLSHRSKKRDQFGGLARSLPQGTITRKGDLIEFVASDLQEKIKQSSPLSQPDAASSGSRRSSIKSYASASSSTSFATSSGLSQSPSSACQQSPDDIPPIDAAAVIELEVHATRVADSLDLMMGNIRNNLHKMSAITIGCQEAYKRSVDITCDSVDASIKTMYALMAKCEELSASMGPVRQLALQIKDIKRVLDLFESQLADK